jgi:hypothetical protein
MINSQCLFLLQVLRSAIRLLIRLRRHESVRLDRAVAGLKTSHMAAAAAAAAAGPAAAAGAAAAAGTLAVTHVSTVLLLNV